MNYEPKAMVAKEETFSYSDFTAVIMAAHHHLTKIEVNGGVLHGVELNIKSHITPIGHPDTKYFPTSEYAITLHYGVPDPEKIQAPADPELGSFPW